MQQADVRQQVRVETGNPKRMEAKGETQAVLKTLTNLKGGRESFSDLAHDARNMVTALALYCELLEEPGVLNERSRHLARELRLVTAASWRLLEKLTRVELKGSGHFSGTAAWRSSPLVEALPGTQPIGSRRTAEAKPSSPRGIEDLADELASNRNLLAALAGPGVTVRVRSTGGASAVRLNEEDLTRILVNLVRNSAEAMHGSGSIKIALSECRDGNGAARARLTIEDSGPGIPEGDLDRVFEKGFSTSHLPKGGGAKNPKLSGGRGLGLSIVRNLVAAAGGQITAGNCPTGGARMVIELPARTE
jgi:signal transduction histidine kinase